MKHRPKARAFSRFDLRQARWRLLVPIAAGLVAAVLIGDVGLRQRLVIGWDAAAAVLLALSWHLLLRTDAAETKRRAGAEDPGRAAVGLVTLVAGAVSFFAAVSLMADGSRRGHEEAVLWTWLCLGGVVSAWLVTHTTWTFRYAHLYYAGGTEKQDPPLLFPGKGAPSDSDFAYFAFTIGMTFQVSDVVIACHRFRRAVLFHAFVSFLYNTAILAVAINLASGSFT